MLSLFMFLWAGLTRAVEWIADDPALELPAMLIGVAVLGLIVAVIVKAGI